MSKNKTFVEGQFAEKLSANPPNYPSSPSKKPKDLKNKETPLGKSARRPEQSRIKAIVERDFSVPQADDLVHDPRYAVPVSRFGLCQGARRRDTEQVRMIDDDGEAMLVRRVRSGLGRLYADGVITEPMMEAAYDFKRAFDVCGYNRVKTMDWLGVRGGGCAGIEDRLVREHEAGRTVDAYMALLGGTASAPGRALWHIVGHEMSLRCIAARADLHDELSPRRGNQYWLGVLVAALAIISEWYIAQSSPRKRSRFRAVFLGREKRA